MSKERRQQVIWMIWAPTIAAILLFLAAAVLVALPSSTTRIDTASLGSLSFIWIAAPFIVLLVVVIAISGAFVYLMAKALQVLPGFFQKVQGYARLAAQKTRQLADHGVSPLVSVKKYHAGLSHLSRKFSARNKSK